MTTNILTDAEAAAALGRGVNDSSKANLLSIANAAVTRLLEGQIGKVVYGTITGETHDGGGNVIYLDYRPVVSIVSAVEYDNTTAATLTAESNTSKPSTGYQLNVANGRVVRRDTNGDARYPIGRDNVVFTYVSGRFATQGSITEEYKLAAAVTLKNGWRTWEASVATLGEFEVPQASFPTFAIPKFVPELLGNDWQVGSGGFD